MSSLAACLILAVFGMILAAVGGFLVSESYDVIKHVLVRPVLREVGLIMCGLGLVNVIPAVIFLWVEAVTG